MCLESASLLETEREGLYSLSTSALEQRTFLLETQLFPLAHSRGQKRFCRALGIGEYRPESESGTTPINLWEGGVLCQTRKEM